MDLCGFESLSVWITIKICRRAGGYGPECGKGPENTFPDFAFNYGGVIKSRAARSKLPRPSLKLEPWESGRNSPGCARPTGLKWSTGGGLGAGRQVAHAGEAWRRDGRQTKRYGGKGGADTASAQQRFLQWLAGFAKRFDQPFSVTYRKKLVAYVWPLESPPVGRTARRQMWALFDHGRPCNLFVWQTCAFNPAVMTPVCQDAT